MLKLLSAGFALSCMFLHPVIGQTTHRRALIIGNSAYSEPPFEQLGQAPAEDAARLTDALVAVGFPRADIMVRNNLSRSEFIEALRTFQSLLQQDDSVLFYFSGHGFSIEGKPYLVPINFSFGKTEAESRRNAMGLEEIIDSLSAARTRVVILDACRTSVSLLKQAVRRGSSSSLNALTAVQANGSLVAYASGNGRPSSATSASGMSLFTNFLVNSLESRLSSVDLLDVINRAKSDTISASHEAQVPAVYDEMSHPFLLGVGSLPAPSRRLPDGTLPVNPYQQVQSVLGEIEGLESLRARGVDLVLHPYMRQNYNPRGVVEQAPPIISDDAYNALYTNEFGTANSFKELTPKIEHAHSQAIEYLGLGPIPREDDERKFRDVMTRVPGIAPSADLRKARTVPLKPRYAELVSYMKDLVDKLGHAPAR